MIGFLNPHQTGFTEEERHSVLCEVTSRLVSDIEGGKVKPKQSDGEHSRDTSKLIR